MLTESDIRRVILDCVANFDSASLDTSTSFVDAGLDSLDHASILLALQEEYGLDIPDEHVDLCDSIENILNYQKERLPSA